MRLVICTIFALALVISFNLINHADIKLKGDNKNMNLKVFNQYQNNIEKLFECILYQDSATIISLFSSYAISEVGVDDFGEMLIHLYEYCKFDHIIKIEKRPGSIEEGSLRGKRMIRTVYESYDIETNNDIYRLCVKLVCTDDFDENSESFWSVSIMKCDKYTEFESNYWGNGTFASGIWFDER